MIKIFRKYTIITVFMLLTLSFSTYARDDNVMVPILLYHNIIDKIEDGNMYVNITPQVFREHMTAIKNEGFNTITFTDYYNYLKGAPLPEKPIILTFDDGYSNNYEVAYPILKELDLKATIFIVTSTVGETENVSYPHFTWEQAREMEKSGVIDIQSHSHSHISMSEMDLHRIVREIRLSKYLIEKNLGKQCDFFAYPFGNYTEECLKIAREAGYKLQNMLGNSGSNSKSSNNELLRRLTIWGNWSSDELLSIINKNLYLDGFE